MQQSDRWRMLASSSLQHLQMGSPETGYSIARVQKFYPDAAVKGRKPFFLIFLQRLGNGDGGGFFS